MYKNLAISCKDGFGSQYLKKMYGFAFCKKNPNYRYVHVPMQRIAGLPPNYASIMNDFIGWEKTTGRKIHVSFDRLEKCFRSPNSFFTKDVIDFIKSKYYSTPKPNSEKDVNVIHIRRNDVTPLSKKQSNKIRFVNDAWYIMNIIKILDKFDEKIIIHTHGNSDQLTYNIIRLETDRIELKVNTEIRQTFHDMVSAKRLFLAKSSLSYMAGILNENDVYFQNGPTDSQLRFPLSCWKMWSDLD